MTADFTVRAAAGSLRAELRADLTFPHRWSDEGVAVEAQFTGAHLLHLATAGCVLNDLYREAVRTGIQLDGVLVTANGDFEQESWRSTGITYTVDLDSPASPEDQERLVRLVDEVAEIPKALRLGAPVRRV